MSTVTLWILFAVGQWSGSPASTTSSVLEYFPTQAECVRVQEAIREVGYNAQPTRCIQATVARPK